MKLAIIACFASLGLALLALPERAPADDAAKRAELYQVAAGKTYNIHANDHARMLGKYAKATGKPVPKEVVAEHAKAIRTNVVQAQQAFKKLSMVAAGNPQVAAQLAEIQKRLAAVTKKVDALQTDNDAEAKDIEDATSDISADLKATHDASKQIDAALASELQTTDESDEFEDRQTGDYFFTGEGHFLD
jgi:chromosome segregation ATPase